MNIIHEHFFHFIWEHSHYAINNIITSCGKRISVIDPGEKNKGDGPDYHYAKLRFGRFIHYGDIELHLDKKDWYRHRHHTDPSYNRVILHVVVNDIDPSLPVVSQDGTAVPTLELLPLLPSRLSHIWKAYHRPESLPCSSFMKTIPEDAFRTILETWDNRYFEMRLRRMLAYYPAETRMETAWKDMLFIGLSEGLGYHKNRHNMRVLARRLCALTPSMAVQKQEEPFDNITELLFQLAGLSKRPLSVSSGLNRIEWDISGSRPGNRPHIRIPQSAELFINLKKISLKTWLRIPVTEAWDDLCTFKHAPQIGKSRKRILFTNCVIPAVHMLSNWLSHNNKYSECMALWHAQRNPLPESIKTKIQQSHFPKGPFYHRLSGLHHYRYYCCKRKCDACEVMKYIVKT